MEAITLLIAVVALIISIRAYQRTGAAAEGKRQVETMASSVDFKKQVDAMASMTDALRERTADALERLEKVIRKAEKIE